MKYTNEEWRPIAGYEGLYEVSNLGRVKMLAKDVFCGHRNEQVRHYDEIIMKQHNNQKGYLMVSLSDGHKRKHFSVHRLVAQAFIPNPNNLPQINHKSEVRTENFVENLEWCDNKYNCNYGHHNENISKAIKGHIVTEDTRKKISKANSGANNGMYGKMPSRPFPKGHIPHNKGIPMSEETKQLLSINRKGKGTKAVHQYSINGVYITSFPSAEVASKELNISARLIARVCQGGRNTTGGFIFRYKEPDYSASA